MAPLIRPGDQVLVSKVTAKQVKFGDIVVFRSNGELVVHRVLKKWQTADRIKFAEKGDSTHTYGLIHGDSIVGRVTMVKGRNKDLSLSPPFSQLTNRVLSLWLRFTSSAVNRLKQARTKAIRRAGRFLSILLLFSSNILVRLCFIVWYPSGLLARGNRETN
jgi:hypothetical protein